jgi:hypothetical protein
LYYFYQLTVLTILRSASYSGHCRPTLHSQKWTEVSLINAVEFASKLQRTITSWMLSLAWGRTHGRKLRQKFPVERRGNVGKGGRIICAQVEMSRHGRKKKTFF